MRLKSYFHLSSVCWMLAVATTVTPAMADTLFEQTNLVSDLAGLSAHADPNLVNPWGIDWGPGSPFWISDNKTGVSTLYNGAGVAFPAGNPLVVTIPPPSGAPSPAAPTGVVFSGGAQNHFAP